MNTPWLYSTERFIKKFNSNFTKATTYKRLITTPLVMQTTHTTHLDLRGGIIKIDGIVMSESDVILLIKSLGFLEFKYKSKLDLAMQTKGIFDQLPGDVVIAALDMFRGFSPEDKIILKEWLDSVEQYLVCLSNNN